VFDLTAVMNGALGGLVAITAGTATVYPWAAVVIGLIGGCVYIGFSNLLIKLQIDDAVDAVPV
jgi:Amt family ammonium transporter